MRLCRIRDSVTARTVTAGIKKYNGVVVAPQRILARPHFTIESGPYTAGWIGFEGRGRGVYELVHLSIKPKFRHLGLAQSATKQTIALAKGAGGRYAYTRINHKNRPSICLARKLGFRQTHRGKTCIFGRPI
ncbi:MAG: GNAT family N-acetyltransferase [Firmicutes bacterium]|nr:GNAT family N-acetyltransferase [Dethiobacter sp.]MBS3887956.1 GNAT family N-acetyltransferase [Bacillota bacterium]MBS4055592.1 GNAT family N-acetyltransferase [Thermaerobacter sp.]